MRFMRSNQSVVGGDDVVVFALRVVGLPGEEKGLVGESVSDLCASTEENSSKPVSGAGRGSRPVSARRAATRTEHPVRKNGAPERRKEKSIRRKVTGKQLGEMAEALFLAKAVGLGFGVTKPWGDSEPYDFIVDGRGGHAGLSRVQLKSAHREGRERGYSFRAHGHSLKAYRERDVDALVAYVVPEDAWHVFPMRVFRKKRSVRLYPGSQRRRSKYEEYREGWWRLMAASETR